MCSRPRLRVTDALHRSIIFRARNEAESLRLRTEASILIRIGYHAEDLTIARGIQGERQQIIPRPVRTLLARDPLL